MSNRKTVIVMGGGISGLAAASQLLQEGCHVTLLEAKSRLGGRIYTLTSESSPIELGAEFVHGKDETFFQFLKTANASLQRSSERNRVFTDGKLVDVDLWKKADQVFHRLDLHERDQTCENFLGSQQLPATDLHQITELLQGFHAAPIQSLSAHALRRSDYSSAQINGTKPFRIASGYHSVIEYLAQNVRKFHGDIRLDSVVKRIDWQPGQVEVSVLHNGRKETYRADAAVITLPLGVLKSGQLDFHPALHEKEEPIQGMGFGTVRKVVLVFKERWWTSADIGLIHSYDDRLPTWWSNQHGPVLIGWAGGPKGAAFTGLSRKEVEDIALESLGHIFSAKKQLLRSLLKRSYSHDWMHDPHVFGAYSYVPVNGLDFPKLLAAPLKETLFFAGEAAVSDAQTGMTFNAYKSGLRAAQEVIDPSAGKR